MLNFDENEPKYSLNSLLFLNFEIGYVENASCLFDKSLGNISLTIA